MTESQKSWREILKTNFTRLEPLLDFLELSDAACSCVLERPRFPLNLPMRLAKKIEKNNLHDPLFLQFVPLLAEMNSTPGYVADPVCDKTFQKTPKGLKKYEGRALLLATGACAMHCRFCFRQNFPYEKEVFGFEEELKWLAQDPSIQEVILSGGDPLSLNTQRLGDLLAALGQISHVKRIRFHTRFPIGIPERIDEELLLQLTQCPQQIFFILHCNHARELDDDVLKAIGRIRRLGIPVLNQSVLLKGVNDTPEALVELCELLVDGGVLPYYLHLLDPVQGTEHFYVSDEKGIELVGLIQKRLSGYAVPRLVREIPGRLSKTWIQ